MNPVSAFLVRARATWPGTCVSTSVGCRETGRGVRSPTQAVGLTPPPPSVSHPLPGNESWVPLLLLLLLSGFSRVQLCATP